MLTSLLRLGTRKQQGALHPVACSVAELNPELQVKSLLTDPALRRSLGLDGELTPRPAERVRAVA